MCGHRFVSWDYRGRHRSYVGRRQRVAYLVPAAAALVGETIFSTRGGGASFWIGNGGVDVPTQCTRRAAPPPPVKKIVAPINAAGTKWVTRRLRPTYDRRRPLHGKSIFSEKYSTFLNWGLGRAPAAERFLHIFS